MRSNLESNDKTAAYSANWHRNNLCQIQPLTSPKLVAIHLCHIPPAYHHRPYPTADQFPNISAPCQYLLSAVPYAVHELLLHVDFTEKDLIVVGDSLKDVEMLSLNGDTCAMCNGEKEAKEAAKEISEFDNDNDGAVKYVNKILGLNI